MFPVPDPKAWKEDAFEHPWDHLEVYAFPLFAVISVQNKAMVSDSLTMVLMAPLWPQSVVSRPILANEKSPSTSSVLEPASSATCSEVSSRAGHYKASHGSYLGICQQRRLFI